MIPIWQTTYYTTTADTLTYYLLSNSEQTLFSGKAYKMPGETNLNINVSGLAAPYLGMNELPDYILNGGSGSTTSTTICDTFKLADSQSILSSYTFVDDWSYYVVNSDLSEVINGHAAPGMVCLITTADTTGTTVTLQWNTADAAAAYPVPSCGKAALYYKTRRGGWASFLIEGYVKRYDDFTWSRYKRFRSTVDPYTRGETTYLNEIQPRWELNTAWLNDEQSKRLAANLLSSPCVYLHLLDVNEIYPVSITDNNVEYKEFRRDGKLIQYKIAVDASNKRIRR